MFCGLGCAAWDPTNEWSACIKNCLSLGGEFNSRCGEEKAKSRKTMPWRVFLMQRNELMLGKRAAQPRAFLWLPFFWRNKRKEKSKWAACVRWTTRWMLLATFNLEFINQSIPFTFCGQKVTKRLVEKKAIFASQNHGWFSAYIALYQNYEFKVFTPRIFFGSLKSPLSLIFRRF